MENRNATSEPPQLVNPPARHPWLMGVLAIIAGLALLIVIVVVVRLSSPPPESPAPVGGAIENQAPVTGAPTAPPPTTPNP